MHVIERINLSKKTSKLVHYRRNALVEINHLRINYDILSKVFMYYIVYISIFIYKVFLVIL